MSATFEINIGLNNCPYTYDGVRQLLENEFKGAVYHRFEVGMYNEDEEPTLVAVINAEASTIRKSIKQLCSVLTQECIPYRPYLNNAGGELVYNKAFVGEQYVYDEQYFIDFLINRGNPVSALS